MKSLDEVCKMKGDLESIKATMIKQLDQINNQISKANEGFFMQKPYTSHSQKRPNFISESYDKMTDLSLEENMNYMKQLSQNIELL